MLDCVCNDVELFFIVWNAGNQRRARVRKLWFRKGNDSQYQYRPHLQYLSSCIYIYRSAVCRPMSADGRRVRGYFNLFVNGCLEVAWKSPRIAASVRIHIVGLPCILRKYCGIMLRTVPLQSARQDGCNDATNALPRLDPVTWFSRFAEFAPPPNALIVLATQILTRTIGT